MKEEKEKRMVAQAKKKVPEYQYDFAGIEKWGGEKRKRSA